MIDEKVSDYERKIAQLYKSIKNRMDKKYVERILQNSNGINFELPKHCNKDGIDTDNNLLHFAFSENNIQIFRLLLNHNADFTVKNGEGFTVIHRAIVEKKYDTTRNRYKNSFVDSVLSAHMRFENTSNPTCDNGLSHFHAACMSDNFEAVEFFLEHGTSVDQSVDVGSPIFAGFGPLHFAARYSCLKTFEILLKYGANVHSQEANGMTPLDILIKRKVSNAGDANEEMIKLLIDRDTATNQNCTSADSLGLSNLHAACVDIYVIERILEKKLDPNQRIDINSPFCAGYTPLHFAALFNFDAVKLLVNKGADIEVKNTENLSPFELCLQRYSVKDIHFLILSKREWANIVLSDDKTSLVDVVFALTKNANEIGSFFSNFELFAQVSIPESSPLWPGCTILHLDVIFSEINESEWPNDAKRIEECLSNGALVTKADCEGRTALHLAFYLQKRRVVELLLQHHKTTKNPSDNNELSHFHIACAARDQSAVERFLSGGVDINAAVNTTVKWHVMCRRYLDCKPRFFFIIPGSTALHINVASGNKTITRLLLDNGADIYAKDTNGFTPIHRLLTSRTSFFYECVHDLLLKVDGLKDSIAEGGLSHLHVASHFDNLEAVERLLNSGADINTRITYKKAMKVGLGVDWFFDPYGDLTEEPLSILSCYAGFTPLSFSMQAQNFKTKEFLVRKGAGLFSKNTERSTEPIYELLLHNCDIVLPILTSNIGSQKLLKKQSGVTMLHVACHAIKPDMVEQFLCSGENVNAQVNADSPIWPGYSPLHVAMAAAVRLSTEDCDDLKKIVQRLLDSGADVTLINGKGETPLHTIDTGRDRPYSDSSYVDLLLNVVENFNTNPTSNQGVSFFHIACIKKDVGKVEKYLKHGMDVNQCVSYFSDRYAGCSPLHLAAGYRSKSFSDVSDQLQTVDLLLNRGADARARDAYDNTPLHAASGRGSSRDLLFEMLIRHGSDVHAENIFGETPMELLAKSGNATWEEVSCLLKHGSLINSYNPVTKEGLIPKIFLSATTKEERDVTSAMFHNLLKSDFVTELDNEGRTCLHNLASVVSSDYCRAWYREDLIERLLFRGCKINHRDRRGKTALHTAVSFKNSTEIRELLKNGADINETDDDEKTAFSYAFEKSCSGFSEHVIELFAKHITKMELCGLYVSELNRQLKAKAIKEYHLEWNGFDNRIERTKRVKIGSTPFTLHDFCFNMNAEVAYSNMSYEQRQEVDSFFQSKNEDNLFEMDYIYTLKYKKASEKLRLIGPALESFSDLIKHELPELCCRVILSFLSSADLENVIALIV